MKVKRHKHVKKVLTFYKANFGIEPPYAVLTDGTFCKAALKFKVNIAEQIPKYLDAQVDMKTTKCAKKECRDLGPLLYGPLKVLDQYGVIECKHDRGTPAAKCLRRLAKKYGRKYLIATQDTELSKDVRSLPGVPLLYISHNAITLEAPSQVSIDRAKGSIQERITPSQNEFSAIKSLKREVFGEEEELLRKKKRKGPKGPNPLSCKKKKNKIPVQIPSKQSNEGRKHKRKRRVKGKGASDIHSS